MKSKDRIVIVAPLGRSGSYWFHPLILNYPQAIGPECVISIDDLLRGASSVDLVTFSKQICKQRYSSTNNLWIYQTLSNEETEKLFSDTDLHETCSCCKSPPDPIFVYHVHDLLWNQHAVNRIIEFGAENTTVDISLVVTRRNWIENAVSCNLYNPFKGVPSLTSLFLWFSTNFRAERRLFDLKKGLLTIEVWIDELRETLKLNEITEEFLFGYQMSQPSIIASKLRLRNLDWSGSSYTPRVVANTLQRRSNLLQETSMKIFTRVFDVQKDSAMKSLIRTTLRIFNLIVLVGVSFYILSSPGRSCFMCGELQLNKTGSKSYLLFSHSLVKFRHKLHQVRRVLFYSRS